MKKIIFPLLAAAAMLTSCDMDLMPKSAILDENAMVSVSDAESFRNGFYNSLRLIGSGYIQTAEIQADMFIGTIINGNRMGDISTGEIYANNGSVQSAFANMYSQVASINYFLPRAEVLLEDADLDERESDLVNRYIAEGLFTRAFCYYYLMDHFCGVYDAATADNAATGMPIQDYYNPSEDLSSYPGRSTLNETYKFIEDDLDKSYTILKAYEVKYKGDSDPSMSPSTMTQSCAIYVGSMTVRALQARVALLKGDWQKAYDYSKEIIASPYYSILNQANYQKMWSDDSGAEIIFEPFLSVQELAGISSTGVTWLTADNDKSDYIATEGALSLYQPNDIRYKAFFQKRSINVFGELVEVPAFNKFPGNASFNVGNGNSLINRPKMFRLAEQVLIAAESAWHLGLEQEANDMIDKIRSKRIGNVLTDPYKRVDYSGDELYSQIQLERARELIGEGFRISDLRRWKLGFVRNLNYDAYPDAASITVVAGGEVYYEADDHRYVWPIPTEEMQTNPQLAGQQNPGY